MSHARYTKEEREEMRKLTRELWAKHYDQNGILSAVERVMEKNRQAELKRRESEGPLSTNQEGGGRIE
jgi:hypothetical protein